jgi:hypothetical protein
MRTKFLNLFFFVSYNVLTISILIYLKIDHIHYIDNYFLINIHIEISRNEEDR